MDNNQNRVQSSNGTYLQQNVEKPVKKKKKKRIFLKIILWILVVALIIGLTIFLAWKISAEFDTIGDMLRYVYDNVVGNSVAVK